MIYLICGAMLLTCYFLGCFNGAVIVSKYILRDDIRDHGSGNAGLTNFYRTFGGGLTFVVILTDMLKGVFSILLANFVVSYLTIDAYAVNLQYAAALSCMLGHIFPATFHFKGGKGILTGGAIILMLDWRIALLVWVSFFILFLSTRYVSLGSCFAGVAFTLSTAYFYPDLVTVLLASIIGGLLLWGHRTNIQRLIKGEENRFQLRKSKQNQPKEG
ncbi:MAG: glycerol-3-phosphate acyltransferase [Eubacteriales bacterium]